MVCVCECLMVRCKSTISLQTRQRERLRYLGQQDRLLARTTLSEWLHYWQIQLSLQRDQEKPLTSQDLLEWINAEAKRLVKMTEYPSPYNCPQWGIPVE